MGKINSEIISDICDTQSFPMERPTYYPMHESTNSGISNSRTARSSAHLVLSEAIQARCPVQTSLHHETRRRYNKSLYSPPESALISLRYI